MWASENLEFACGFVTALMLIGCLTVMWHAIRFSSGPGPDFWDEGC